MVSGCTLPPILLSYATPILPCQINTFPVLCGRYNNTHLALPGTLRYPSSYWWVLGILSYPNLQYWRIPSTLRYPRGQYLRAPCTLCYSSANTENTRHTILLKHILENTRHTALHQGPGEYPAQYATRVASTGEHITLPKHLLASTGNTKIPLLRVASTETYLGHYATRVILL